MLSCVSCGTDIISIKKCCFLKTDESDVLLTIKDEHLSSFKASNTVKIAALPEKHRNFKQFDCSCGFKLGSYLPYGQKRKCIYAFGPTRCTVLGRILGQKDKWKSSYKETVYSSIAKVDAIAYSVSQSAGKKGNFCSQKKSSVGCCNSFIHKYSCTLTSFNYFFHGSWADKRPPRHCQG